MGIKDRFKGMMEIMKLSKKVEELKNEKREVLIEKFTSFLNKLEEINQKYLHDEILSNDIKTCLQALKEDNVEVFEKSYKLIRMDLMRIARGVK
jgi:hypothetical protein